jgi:hypothetical protein
VDTQGQVALGTITIVDVGTACETPIDGTLTLTPASVVVGVGGSSTVLISGGSGKYVASSLVPQVSASVSGSQLTVTGVGTTNNSEVDAVQITDIADRTRKVTLKVRVD